MRIRDGKNSYLGWKTLLYLGLDDGEGGEWAAAHGLRHLSGTLQQAGVKVEHVTWVSLQTE